MTDVGRYWETVAEIDFIMYELENMLKTERSLSAFDRMIDSATGFDEIKLANAKKLIRRCKMLQKRISA